jgi:hypothetical protein
MRLGTAAAAALALAMAGCSADYVEQNNSSVLLLIDSINGGAPVLSDVRGSGDNPDTIVNCFTDVVVRSVPKNPTVSLPQTQDVLLTRYEVSYRRSDGRGVPGVDVPYPISGNITQTVPVNADVTMSVDLVRHQAKIVPPLSNITGIQIVTMQADVTLVGQTIAGQAVQASGSVPVTFADYGTGTQACEAGS